MTGTPKSIGTTRLLMAATSGLLLTASFPWFGMSALAWFALTPLLTALDNLSGFDRFRVGFLTGMVHYLSLLYWFIPFLNTYGPFPLVISFGILFLISAYLALYLGFFSSMIAWSERSMAAFFLTVPALWVMLEYIRSHAFGGFPWELLGHTQYNRLHIIQISDILGVYGISFLILLSNVQLFLLYQHFRRRNRPGRQAGTKRVLFCVLAVVMIVGLVWRYGAWRISRVTDRIRQAPTRTIAIVQGNIDQTQKWDPAYQISTIQKYVGLSLKASDHRPDLLVWPETAMPFYFGNDTPLTKMVIEGIQSGTADTLLGSPAYKQEADRLQYFNRAFLVRADGAVVDEYDKAHLVPFGEYVPLKRWLPFLGKMVAHVGDFSSGAPGDTLEWGEKRIGVLICYELIFPFLSRAAVQNGADLLVNITNDAWYGKTGAPFQHFSMAVFRAVETRRALVRCANTGISGFIDPLGKVVSRTPIFKDAVSVEEVPLLLEQSFYVRFGDLFAIACSLAALAFILSERFNLIGTLRTR